MTSDSPITEICIVSERLRCPMGFSPVTNAYDDSSDADLWKDSMFSFSRIYRYVCINRSPPQNTIVCNVVADVALISDKDFVPTGYSPIEYTSDTNEKALRKKILCVRSVPREFAVDAVCDLIILARQKKPPPGYTLAGDLEGLLLCYKYGVIPPNFPNRSIQGPIGSDHAYPNLPYPIHPLKHSSNGPPTFGVVSPTQSVENQQPPSLPQNQPAFNRQTSLISSGHYTGIEGLPFELNPRITLDNGKTILPPLKPLSFDEFDYDFNVESTVVVS